jgi:hypothetical protein
MDNHTTGPWKVHTNIGRKGEIGIVAEAAPCIIAIMGNAKEWPVEAQANAKLICAAPAMLEALRDLLAECVDHVRADGGDDTMSIQSARRAIALATGKE